MPRNLSLELQLEILRRDAEQMTHPELLSAYKQLLEVTSDLKQAFEAQEELLKRWVKNGA